MRRARDVTDRIVILAAGAPRSYTEHRPGLAFPDRCGSGQGGSPFQLIHRFHCAALRWRHGTGYLILGFGTYQWRVPVEAIFHLQGSWLRLQAGVASDDVFLLACMVVVRKRSVVLVAASVDQFGVVRIKSNKGALLRRPRTNPVP